LQSFIARLFGVRPHPRRRVHDDGVAFVEFPERQFAIEIQRDKKMFARPIYCRCLRHAPQLAKIRQHCEARKFLPKAMFLARCLCRIMMTETESAIVSSNPAAVFACAVSLWQAS
jgi:hypothetical protein